MADTGARTLRLLSLLQHHRFWPGRELADRLAVADLSGGARRAVRIVLPDGSPLPPAAELMARGSALHTVIGGVWLSLDLDEVT